MNFTHHLRPLLVPSSVALVGASGRAGSLGRIVCENLLAGGFSGELHLVNPNRNTVLGRKVFRSLRSIDRVVDLAVICAPPDAVPAIITECRGRVSAVAILTSAPAVESDAYHRWRRQLARRARSAGVRMLGPASFGVMRPSLGLNATFGAVAASPGRLALISQSGAVASALLDFARAAGIGFSSVVALGAAGDVDFGEVLEFALADAETEGIVVYVESVRNARAFLSALRAAARTKPVVVLKSGRALAANAAPGYGTLAPDQAFDAALRRAGTVRVHTYTQLFAAVMMLAAGRIPRGNRLGVVTNGRGPGLMATDRAAEMGVVIGTLSDKTSAALKSLLPCKCSLDNPVDIESEATPMQFATAVRVVLDDPGVDAVLALHVAVPAAPPTETARAVAAAARDAGKPLLAAWLGAVDRPEARMALEAGGAVSFYTPEGAIEAFSFMAAYRRNQAWLLEVPPPQPEMPAPDMAAALRVRTRVLAAGRTSLTAGETQVLLAAFGVAMPQAVVTKVEDAQSVARRIGYPVALQLDGDGDGNVGPTRAHLRNAAAVARAFADLCAAEPPARKRRRKTSIIVRGDFKPVADHAAKIALYTDEVFGPVIGFGGAFSRTTELAIMLAPLNRRLAGDLIRGGEHGEHAGAIEPLIDMLLKISALACALPWVVEVELLPVLGPRDAAIVAEARVIVDVTRPALPEGYRHMAIHPYPIELETEIRLKDGVVLPVRPIRPEDAQMEQAFVGALSEQSRYYRFMQHLPSLTPQMLARFTQVDYDRELALVALDDSSGTECIVAVARYVANLDKESAEFAIVLADAWQGRGLGAAMMKMLIGRARARGFKRLIGSVLAVNQAMIGLARALGFAVRSDPDDGELMIVTLELPPLRRTRVR
jgi:acetyltransferase